MSLDRAKIEELLAQLESAKPGWLGDAQREVASRALKAHTRQDFGVDAARWRDWWGEVSGVACSAGETAAPMSKAHAAAFKALRAMGVLDIDEFRAWDGSFEELDKGLRYYLGNRSGPSLWVSLDSRYPLKGDYDAQSLRGRIERVLGGDAKPKVEVRPDERLTLSIGGGPAVEISGDELPRIFCALHAWTQRARPERRLVITDEGHVRLLTPPNIAAIRDHGLIHLHLLDPNEPGQVHPEVAAAKSRLSALGVELGLADRDLAWRVFEPTRELGVEAQLVALDDGGLRLARDSLDTDVHAKAARAALGRLAGAAVPTGRSDEAFVEYMARVNRDLHDAKASRRLLVAPDRRTHFVRVLGVPFDRCRALADLLGAMELPVPLPGEGERSGVDRFSLRLAPEHPAGPVYVFDGECVDGAEDYVPLVRDLLALAGLSAESIDCVEDDDEVRRLTIVAGGATCKAKLEGATDWVDMPPLLQCLNRVAKALGAKGRFRPHESLRRGQEFEVVFS